MTAKTALVTSLAIFTLMPSSIGTLRFLQLTTPLYVSAEKSHPPYIAFQEAERNRARDAWDRLDERKSEVISTDLSSRKDLVKAPVRLALATDVIRVERLEPTRMTASVPAPPAVEPLEQKTWEERVREAVAKVDAETKKPTVPAADPTRQTGQGIASSDVLNVTGEFQLENLGYLNDYQLEIRRRQEGVYEEAGRVLPLESTYSIKVAGQGGEIVIRLRDNQNRVIGESSVPVSRVRQMAGVNGQVRGPKMIVSTKSDVAGRATPVRYAGTRMRNDVVVPGVQGRSSIPRAAMHVAKNGEFEVNNMKRGSFSVVSMTAEDHETTSMLVGAGFRSSVPLFPVAMMKALKEIVSDQRQMNLNNASLPVIWGQAKVDGKTVAGVAVEVESAPGYEAIYFNELMIPEPKLKATSTNGLFAFVGVPEGLHALLGRQNDRYFAHQNLVVRNGEVAVGDLESGLRAEQAVLRVFDAFTGESRSAEVVHQGAETPLQVSGMTTIRLASIHRLSQSRVQPPAPYASARYYSDDERGYVHYPLVREDWLQFMKAQAKIPDLPGTSVVVGFVPEDDFKVDFRNSEVALIYFDVAGRLVDRGVQGGGFIAFGVAPGVQEVVLNLGRSGELATQTIASDAGGLTVLRFQED